MRIFVLGLCLFFAGCIGPAQKSEFKNNYKVDFLFEQDGCRVYRFEDGGHFNYFVTREGSTFFQIGKTQAEIYTK